MTRVTNADLYGVLLEIKEDIGSLKKSSDVHVEAIRNHTDRLIKLEGAAQRQKGAAKVWGLIATGAATITTAVIEYWRH